MNTSQMNESLSSFFAQTTTTRAIFILAVTFAIAYLVSTITSRAVIKIAKMVALRSDSTSSEEKSILFRRVETYFSVAIAVWRAVIYAVAIYIAFTLILPGQSALITTIGAGTFFVVVANATVAPLLRDFTSGAMMIAERWFSVGDYVRIEPFGEVGGVVERVTLRSTKLRDLNGEAIWLHNQYIQGARVTPRGVRTMAVDLFVRKPEAAQALIDDVCRTLPIEPTMLVQPIRLDEKEKIGDNLWRLSLIAKTAPGREWLIEKFLAEALKDADEQRGKERIIMYGPLVRYSDELAEKRFRRAVSVTINAKNKKVEDDKEKLDDDLDE